MKSNKNYNNNINILHFGMREDGSECIIFYLFFLICSD